jgi:hypothetical protein
MKIKFENQILDPAVRAQVIMEIEASENRNRKHESYRRYLCYKDQTIYFVVANLLRQFSENTVISMRYSISNISIVRKVIDKLSRVYSVGVKREISGKDEDTKKLQELEKIIDINSKMKQANRYLKLQKNCALYMKPCPRYNEDGSSVEWTLVPEVLQPHNYDVIEDEYDKTRPLAFILSDYTPEMSDYSKIDPGLRPQGATILARGDGRDQIIADSPDDSGKGQEKTYIWWSKNFHFTTNSKGEIIADPGNTQNKNPFGVEMIIGYGIDQDNQYWAQGGGDLIDGAILLNGMITHNNHVGVTQGYGQFYMTGQNLPGSVEIGPTKMIKLEYNKEEQAEPKIGFASANPNLGELRGLVEAYIALLLTTNNLSTAGVSAQLSGGKDFASGISLIIDKAESLEDVSDQQQIFVDKEGKVFDAARAFLDTYRDQLIEPLKEIKLPDDIGKTLSTSFQEPEPIQSEKERLENYKLRMELGLDTLVTIIMKENPGITEDQAEKQLLKQLAQEIEIQLARRKALEANPDNDNVDPETGETIPPEGQQDPENQDDPAEDPEKDDTEE